MKQIIVNVRGLTIDQKMRVNEALAKIKNVRMCEPLFWDNIVTLYGPSFDGVCVGFEIHASSKPTHTPHQVLKMSRMTKKRNVRKDFDPKKEYSVNVSGRNEEIKKEVQQAFFDAGFKWESGGSNDYQHLHAMMYTNTAVGVATNYCLFGTTTSGCNMSAEEFIELVYEPEKQGHVHAENMALFAEDAKHHKEPWKLWEFRWGNGEWLPVRPEVCWDLLLEYRRKPKTHIVNGVEIPDLRIKPIPGQVYLYPDPSSEDLVQTTTHGRHPESDSHRMANNLCYKISSEGKQAAILHAKAWLGV